MSSENTQHEQLGDSSRDRISIMIAGRSGQGVNSVGEILAKAFKRTGFWVYAYREYPSLIKGGHATYQIEFSNEKISATTKTVDAVLVLNRQGTDWKLDQLKEGGMIFHYNTNPRINQEEARIMNEKRIKMIYVPALRIATECGGNELMTNIICSGYMWKLLGLDIKILEDIVHAKFAHKGEIAEINVKCLNAGYGYSAGENPEYAERLIKPGEISSEQKSELHIHDEEEIDNATPEINEDWKNNILITGNEALSIGAINAGVRMHVAYPMTPSSSILNFLAENAKESGMIVKQAEGEITAAAMAIGAMHMGTRAMTATSGGGFDLMTEHVSLAGMTETPFVCVIAQRPGPATGLPTWTASADLMLACFAGHGEFSRCVMTLRDPEDAFYTIQHAFNIAEEYQMPVLVLTDKLIAETYFSVEDFDQNSIAINRGELITDPEQLSTMQKSERFKITQSGVSPRWIPGSSPAGYNANSDEHDSEGAVTEKAEPSREMISKRLRKLDSLAKFLPKPELFYNNVDLDRAKAKVRFIGWGSPFGVMQDTMMHFEKEDIKIDYLDVKYLWPLDTESITEYLNAEDSVPLVLIENNATAQLGQLIRMQTGIEIQEKLLKWDGRPFFLEEVIEYVNQLTITN